MYSFKSLILIRSALVLSACILSSCTVYRSPDRKDFESGAASFKVQNLQASECSHTSIKTQATASKLVNIIKADSENESAFLWEHLVNDQSIFESDNLKGNFCIYENI